MLESWQFAPSVIIVDFQHVERNFIPGRHSSHLYLFFRNLFHVLAIFFIFYLLLFFCQFTGLSLLQGGPYPCFFSQTLKTQITSSNEDISDYVCDLRDGMEYLGIVSVSIYIGILQD